MCTHSHLPTHTWHAHRIAYSRWWLSGLEAGNPCFLRRGTAALFAKVCTGMFRRVGAVSSQCRGHHGPGGVGGSEFTSYVSAIEKVLCYMLKRHWNSVFRGRSGWSRQEMFSNRKMIKILMTCEDNAACSLLLSTWVHLHPCFHGHMCYCESIHGRMHVLCDMCVCFTWLVKQVHAGHMRTYAELKNL